MRATTRRITGALALCLATATPLSGQASSSRESQVPENTPTGESLELGRRMYRQGVRPGGDLIRATIQGDIPLTGDQVICGSCHRRSGLGSSEGQEVVPSVTGDILYRPLRIPTSKPPLSPAIRPAYDDESLKRAITEGVGADGQPLSALMPRYQLNDAELDTLLAYLKSLSTRPSPGVGDGEIHFATVIADGIEPAARDAYLKVFEAFFRLKNTETRNEGRRARHAPWHKEWAFGPYRKWVFHVWNLNGPRESWPDQLAAQYREQPVFALLGGIAPGSWQPVHSFCQSFEVPCLFPETDLPVIAEEDFYSVYFSKGMVLEAQTVATHLAGHDDGGRILQVLRKDSPRAVEAAAALDREFMAQGRLAESVVWDPAGTWLRTLAGTEADTAVLWLDEQEVAPLWLAPGSQAKRIYLSATLYPHAPADAPASVRERTFYVQSSAPADKRHRLLARSNGWLRANRVHAPAFEEPQADAYFALRMAGGALKRVGGFLVRDYFLEQLEHMVDSAVFTSVYPRLSLAPGQRFAVKGAHVTRLGEPNRDKTEASLAERFVPHPP